MIKNLSNKTVRNLRYRQEQVANCQPNVYGGHQKDEIACLTEIRNKTCNIHAYDKYIKLTL